MFQLVTVSHVGRETWDGYIFYCELKKQRKKERRIGKTKSLEDKDNGREGRKGGKRR
jgi:hypothetical protein